jgi:hypothetical protein
MVLQSDNKRVIRKFGKKELALENGVQYSWFDITQYHWKVSGLVLRQMQVGGGGWEGPW